MPHAVSRKQNAYRDLPKAKTSVLFTIDTQLDIEVLYS